MGYLIKPDDKLQKEMKFAISCARYKLGLHNKGFEFLSICGSLESPVIRVRQQL